jgi:hypothetical protein
MKETTQPHSLSRSSEEGAQQPMNILISRTALYGLLELFWQPKSIRRYTVDSLETVGWQRGPLPLRTSDDESEVGTKKCRPVWIALFLEYSNFIQFVPSLLIYSFLSFFLRVIFKQSPPIHS